MESRKHSKTKSSPLPLDYLKMVEEVFTTNFQDGLKALASIQPEPRFEASGAVFGDEILLTITLSHKDQLAATSAHASCDFDPTASSPTAEQLLALCVDAIGSFYAQFLSDPHFKDIELLQQLTQESLSAIENAPFEWTPFTFEKRQVFLRVDKANPKLEQMTEQWLEQNDPEHQARKEQEQKETEDLFIGGPELKNKKRTIH